MAKRMLPKAFLAFWMVLLVALGSYYIFLAPRDGAYSEEENRTLAGFPKISFGSVFSGQFGKDFETYLLDHFPVRNVVISGANKAQNLMSFASHDEYLLIAEGVKDPLDQGDYKDDLDDLLSGLVPGTTTVPPTTVTVTQPSGNVPTTTVPPQTTVPAPTEPPEDPPIVQKPTASLDDFDAYLGMYMNIGSGDAAVMSYNKENVAAVTAVLNKYAALLPENGKLMFTMGPPSYMVNRYVNASTKNGFYNTWDELINAMGSDNVYAFDSAEILAGHIENGEYVAFRTDNHWTPYGAYQVYSYMAAQAGKELCSYPDDFTITVEDPFRGTYYRDNPAAYMNVLPDVLELVLPKIGVEFRQITGKDEYKVIPFLNMNANSNDRYAVYLSGPGGPWRYVECDNAETENCLVVTDSFGLTVIPYLTSNYKQVHYYDARYYDYGTVGYSVAEMIEKYNIQDIYVIVADFHTFNSGFLMSNANYHLTMGK